VAPVENVLISQSAASASRAIILGSRAESVGETVGDVNSKAVSGDHALPRSRRVAVSRTGGAVLSISALEAAADVARSACTDFFRDALDVCTAVVVVARRCIDATARPSVAVTASASRAVILGSRAKSVGEAVGDVNSKTVSGDDLFSSRCSIAVDSAGVAILSDPTLATFANVAGSGRRELPCDESDISAPVIIKTRRGLNATARAHAAMTPTFAIFTVVLSSGAKLVDSAVGYAYS